MEIEWLTIIRKTYLLKIFRSRMLDAVFPFIFLLKLFLIHILKQNTSLLRLDPKG